jgi:hypothetical protein
LTMSQWTADSLVPPRSAKAVADGKVDGAVHLLVEVGVSHVAGDGRVAADTPIRRVRGLLRTPRQPHGLNRDRGRAPPRRPDHLHLHDRTPGAGGSAPAAPAPRDHSSVLGGTPRVLKIHCFHHLRPQSHQRRFSGDSLYIGARHHAVYTPRCIHTNP